jgi:hypothetical protein
LNEEDYYAEDDEEYVAKKENKINSDIIYDIDILYKNETNYIYLELNASTTNISVYTPETLKEIVLSLETELIQKMNDVMNKVSGSGWAIYRYNKMYSILHTINTRRAGSYIKTPEKYDYPKCGLINIKNEDDECFKHCTSYHQTKQEKHDNRLTVLSKFNNTYNYKDISYPTSLEDVKQFEINNELCITSYTINKHNDVITHQLGNLKYHKIRINLLLIYDEEHTKSHFIYIKTVERLLNISTTSLYKDKNCCPYCNKVVNNDIPFEEHLFKTHYDTTNNCNISLPKEGDKMAFFLIIRIY